MTASMTAERNADIVARLDRMLAEHRRLREVERPAGVLVEALPKCAECQRPATRHYLPPKQKWHRCDKHKCRYVWYSAETCYAAQLRALLVALGVE